MEAVVNHLLEDALLELLSGRGSAEQRQHLASCPRCRDELAAWQTLLDDLHAARDTTLAPAELHQLNALFRAFGPARRGCKEWIARLLQRPEQPALQVRGGTPVPMEHQAGPFHVAMQVRRSPTPANRTLIGQVFSDEGEEVEGEVVLSSDSGVLSLAEIDDLGEFSIPVPAGGQYRATLLLPLSRIVIESLDIS